MSGLLWAIFLVLICACVFYYWMWKASQGGFK